MKMKSVKRASDVQLDGITVEIVTVDGSLTSVMFTDASGHVATVSIESYSLTMCVPEPKAKVRKHRLHGAVGPFGQFDELFDDRYQAETKRDRLSDMLSDPDGHTLEISEVEVEAQE